MNEPLKTVCIPLKPGSESTITFSENTISYGDTTLRYDDIIGIAFHSGYSQGHLVDNSAGVIKLRSASKRLKVTIRNFSIAGNAAGHVSNYGKICQEVMARVAPILLQRLAKAVLDGRTVSIGSFTLNSDGVTHSGVFGTRRRAPWSLRPEMRTTSKSFWLVPATQSGILEVSYFFPPTGKMISVGTVTSSDENGCLLSSLLTFFTSVYNSRTA